MNNYIASIVLALFVVSFSNSACAQHTSVTCNEANCPSTALPLIGNGRALGNKVDNSFSGYADVSFSQSNNEFSTNLQVRSGQAWPRLYQGATYPLVGSKTTPYYPITVSWLTSPNVDTRYISYSGYWTRRTRGPRPRPKPRGSLSNGAYIWLNDPNDRSKWESNGSPKWPYSVEINIWNHYSGSGHRSGAKRFADYYDSNGKYEVRGHYTGHDASSFYAYYLTLQGSNKGTGGMVVNLKALMKHLVENTNDGNNGSAAKSHFKIIEVCVAAEGFAPSADGKFVASVSTMGRP